MKSVRVLAAAMDSAGLMTPARRDNMHNQIDPSPDDVVGEYHLVLVRMIHEPDPARRRVQGQGNFGEPDGSEPPANPLFTECCLTARGMAEVSEAAGRASAE